MHSVTLRSIVRGVVACIVSAVMLFSVALPAAEYPPFDQKYWEDEEGKARGKILRGAVLGATGLVTAAPTAVLAVKAAENPEQYLAYSAAVGIAALGMTLHGFFSIGFGARQRDKAAGYVELYKQNSAEVNQKEERADFLRTQKKSTGKMILFGIVLDVQAAVLLANGIVLSVRKSNNTLSDGVTIWPTYLTGGLLLLGGTAFAVLRGRKYLDLVDLGRRTAPVGEVSFAPMVDVNPVTGDLQVGLVGGLTF